MTGQWTGGEARGEEGELGGEEDASRESGAGLRWEGNGAILRVKERESESERMCG